MYCCRSCSCRDGYLSIISGEIEKEMNGMFLAHGFIRGLTETKDVVPKPF